MVDGMWRQICFAKFMQLYKKELQMIDYKNPPLFLKIIYKQLIFWKYLPYSTLILLLHWRHEEENTLYDKGISLSTVPWCL